MGVWSLQTITEMLKMFNNFKKKINYKLHLMWIVFLFEVD